MSDVDAPMDRRLRPHDRGCRQTRCMFALCQCWCHEGPAAQAQLWPYQRRSDAPEVASVRDLEGPPAVLIDPEALRLVEEIASYSAPVVRAGVTAKEMEEGAGLLTGMVRAMVEERGMRAPETADLIGGETDQDEPVIPWRALAGLGHPGYGGNVPGEVGVGHRYLHVSFVVSSYGTAEQAEATVMRLRRMLTTELHQPVIWYAPPFTVPADVVLGSARGQGCSCYETANPEQGPVKDVDCKVHGKHAR